MPSIHASLVFLGKRIGHELLSKKRSDDGVNIKLDAIQGLQYWVQSEMSSSSLACKVGLPWMKILKVKISKRITMKRTKYTILSKSCFTHCLILVYG